jgi:aminoglycoside phosphotransferase (APT) family kinase protein
MPPGVIGDEAILAALQLGLHQRGTSGAITRIERRPSLYASSFALEELDVELDDGSRLVLMLKNLSRRAMNDDALRVKPDFLFDARREIAVYRHIVEPQQLGAALFAAHADPKSDECWLVIERIDGRELYQVGELDTWTDVARWLGAMHDRLARLDLDRLTVQARLVVYDADFYYHWLSRAETALAKAPAESRASRAAFDHLRAHYHRVIERLQALPVTVIHGEFYASNVLTASDHGRLRVCPVDWEMAGLAPGLIDLAALTLGQWAPEDLRTFFSAYLGAMPDGARSMALDDLVEAVDYCQIHLAVQWLGWFSSQPPHPSHARDWLGEAVERVERLRL